MKKFIAALLVILTFTALFASCGQPADTTAPDTSEILPFETNAPDTDNGLEASGDPLLDPDEETENPQKDMLFDFDLSNVTDKDTSSAENFTLTFSKWSKSISNKNDGANGTVRIKDNDLALADKSFMVECDITFDVLPHMADGVDAKQRPRLQSTNQHEIFGIEE